MSTERDVYMCAALLSSEGEGEGEGEGIAYPRWPHRLLQSREIERTREEGGGAGREGGKGGERPGEGVKG